MELASNNSAVYLTEEEKREMKVDSPLALTEAALAQLQSTTQNTLTKVHNLPAKSLPPNQYNDFVINSVRLYDKQQHFVQSFGMALRWLNSTSNLPVLQPELDAERQTERE